MKIYTLDSETDPFLKGRNPQPFAWDLYDGVEHHTTWGDNCTVEIMGWLWTQEPGVVYLHNGGKFDIFYLLPWIDTEKDMLIIKEHITQCYVKCATGYHRLRDSLKILPFSLDTYQKTKIDYSKFERDVREQHKFEILEYLKDDCVFLRELVTAYFAQFGPSITIGSTAMKELKKFHHTGDVLTADMDASLRSKYFFGARVERYQTGVFQGDWKCYDVNSMYPYVMANYYHPIGAPHFQGGEITENTYFVTATGLSHGAFPVRTKLGVSFPHERNTFSVTIHEWKTALELGLFECDEILECVEFESSNMFDNYTLHYYALKQKAVVDLESHVKVCDLCVPDDKRFCGVGNQHRIAYIFYKYLLNNSYGRFAINPESFKEYRLAPDTDDLRWHGFEIDTIIEEFNLVLWSKPSEDAKYSNIATGASVTGGARSVLMKGVHNAVRPMYCDTDSLICEELIGCDIDSSQLGAWKLEKTGNSLAIAGRKMYALFNESKCVKYACKGVRITPEDIVRVASGEVITYERDAPTYRLNGNVDWITRKVRMV